MTARWHQSWAEGFAAQTTDQIGRRQDSTVVEAIEADEVVAVVVAQREESFSGTKERREKRCLD